MTFAGTWTSLASLFMYGCTQPCLDKQQFRSILFGIDWDETVCLLSNHCFLVVKTNSARIYAENDLQQCLTNVDNNKKITQITCLKTIPNYVPLLYRTFIMIPVYLMKATVYSMCKSITAQSAFFQFWVSFNHALLCKYFGLLLRLLPSCNVTHSLPVPASSRTLFSYFFPVHGAQMSMGCELRNRSFPIFLEVFFMDW